MIICILQIYKRDLDDNLQLRKAQTEIENYEKEDAELNEKLNGINREELNEKQSLISQQTKLFREKATLEGRLSELKVCEQLEINITHNYFI